MSKIIRKILRIFEFMFFSEAVFDIRNSYFWFLIHNPNKEYETIRIAEVWTIKSKKSTEG